MTGPLLSILGGLFIAAIYLAIATLRRATGPGDHVDAGRRLPSWVIIFGGGGVVSASLGLHDHLILLARFGLQYNQVAVGVVLVALCAVLVQKRLWLASRTTGLRSAGELLGEYYGSVTIRISMLTTLFLFSVPFAASSLADLGTLVESATSGRVPAMWAIWSLAVSLFLTSAIGGWRGTAYVIAMQALLVLVVLILLGGLGSVVPGSLSFVQNGIATSPRILSDVIPGVMQFTAGIGKAEPSGGIWTAIAGLSFTLSLLGIVLSPGFSFLGLTVDARRGLAFGQVWIVGGLVAGLLVLVGPVIAAEMTTSGTDLAAPFAALLDRLGGTDRILAAAFVVMLIASLQIAVGFFTASGASIVTIELTERFLLPNLSPSKRRLAARIALAVICLAVAGAATFAPLATEIFSSLTLSLSAQMLPAFLGLCWIPWITRSGVIVGLILGTILVGFTEPFGLIIFERLFVDLPWGRWPLTIHSAAWGLGFNFTGCLLVSLFTRRGVERERREMIHDAFAAIDAPGAAARATRTAKWTLTLIWTFLAIGPGAILGNQFFSQPIFVGAAIAPGLPSLLIWQVFFWFLGVLIVWWLAYQGRMSIIADAPRRTVSLKPAANPLDRPDVPPWISRVLGRVAGSRSPSDHSHQRRP